ncbi:MAG TPA: hypothetical protein VES01_06010 [Dermatophilaceae bacterium]|nr:hypothetical protein [Dermatophilaceae bacterium]
MSSLPIAVRVALWVTAAHRDHRAGAVDTTALRRAIRAAAVEVDTPISPERTLRSWAELGEHAVLMALPRAGDLTGLPRGPANFTAAAVDAGECVYAPALGAALVPRLHRFGSLLEPGLEVRWDCYDCDPMPTHRLEALAIRDIEARLTQHVAAAVVSLDAAEALIWPAAEGSRGGTADSQGWALPPGIPARSMALIAHAASIGDIAEDALARHATSVAASGLNQRDAALRQLTAAADAALADATCVAALSMAGLRPGRPD